MTRKRSNDQSAYLGMWVTKDGHIRHEFLTGGRYEGGRGNRRSASRAATCSPLITSAMWTTPASPPTVNSATACCITQAWCCTTRAAIGRRGVERDG